MRNVFGRDNEIVAYSQLKLVKHVNMSLFCFSGPTVPLHSEAPPVPTTKRPPLPQHLPNNV